MPLPEARPRALLLDLDDTAYPYAPCHAAGLAAAAAASHGWPDRAAFDAALRAARADVKARVGPRAASHCRLLYFKAMIEAAHGRSDLRLALALHDAYWAAYADEMRLEPGCLGALVAWREAGVRLAWVTNFTTERQIRKLATLGLLDACDLLVTSEEAGADKPDAAPFVLALARLGAAPAEAWMVGDSMADDVGAARAIGLGAAILYRRPGAPGGPAAGADAVIGSWGELAALAPVTCRG